MSHETLKCDTFTVVDSIRQRRIGDEGIVLKQQEAEILVLNEVGARVLELVSEGRTFDQIVDQLLIEYRTERPTLENDVAAYLEELSTSGVIVRRSGEGI